MTIQILPEPLIKPIAAGEGENLRLRSTSSRRFERPERSAGPRAGEDVVSR